MTRTSRVFVLLTYVTAALLQPPQEFSQQELLCFQRDSVFFQSAGKCFKLFEKGPCDSDQWVVLDNEAVVTGGRLRAVCRKCPCCDKPYKGVYWPGDGQCHRLYRDGKQLCPFPGTSLQVDPFGEGECACDKEPLHARLEPKDGDGENAPCYPLYRRGPCDSGHIFVPFDNTTRCERDPCVQQNRETPTSTFVAWRGGDNKCYELGSKGPCPGNSTSTFTIHPVTRRPDCISRSLQIVDLPPTCDTDQNGNCRKEVALPSQTQYLNDLLLAAKKRAKRRIRQSKY